MVKSIDVVKGVLIIFVIIGHILQGKLSDNYIRLCIYSFHMPMFLFISGYLMNVQKITTYDYVALFKIYWHRMLRPWCLAIIVYALFNCVYHGVHIDYFRFITKPFYHLWYIEFLFGFILLFYAGKKMMEINTERLCIGLICIGLLFTAFYGFHENPLFERVGFLLYFSLGVFCKHICEKKYRIYRSRSNTAVSGGILFILLLIINLLIYNTVLNFSYRNIFYIPILISICVYVLLPCIRNDYLNSSNLVYNILSFVGRKSLYFYLWHILPLLICRML